MFAVGWLELKEVQRAQALLNKCFSNITEPFKVSWVLCPTMGVPRDQHSLALPCCSQMGHITLRGTAGVCAGCTCGHRVIAALSWVVTRSDSFPRASQEQ